MKATASMRREPVMLQARANIVDPFDPDHIIVGGGDWETLAQCWARIKHLTGSETVIAARLTGTQPAIITIPINPETATIMSDWRIVHSATGKVYDVKSFADMEGRGEQWEILAESQT